MREVRIERGREEVRERAREGGREGGRGKEGGREVEKLEALYFTFWECWKLLYEMELLQGRVNK